MPAKINFNNDKAMDAIDFIQTTKLTGDFYGQPFMLLPWQREIISDVYGTVNAQGYRQYRTAYLEVPKKNGKTELIASIGLYHLSTDPPGGQIYCCAADKEQAGLVYQAMIAKIEQDDYLQEILKVTDSKKMIANIETGTYVKVVSSEAYSKHGLNPTVVIFDELHAQPNRELWDVMSFGAGAARKQPIMWVITTAGDDADRKTIGWEIHEQARKISVGELQDDTWYVKIFGAPDDADIYEEKLWYEVNPSLGVSISIESVRQEAVAAKNSEASERLFRWLRLNQWVAIKRIGWLPITLWDKSEENWSINELSKKRCYVGIDLSSKIDLTCVTPVFPPQSGFECFRFLHYTFCPSDNIAERSKKDKVPYDRWLVAEHLIATPGDVIDYQFIVARLIKIEKQFDVQYYCGDPWHLEILKQMLPEQIQRKFVEIPQTMAGMSSAMGELERLFRASEISHSHDPLGRWSFGNVRIATDGNENIKPVKNKSIERIDPTVSLINGMAGAIKLEKKRSVYETRGIRSV